MDAHRFVFPFSAIVGQEQLKLGLILNAINNHLGGLLICGAKGTAKSTAVRSLAVLLPEITVVDGCPFNCHPGRGQLCPLCRNRLARGKKLATSRRQMHVVELPLAATEDRVVGSLDFGGTIKNGRPAFEPGLLARAHRNLLYVDEINLLDHHLVDALLDAAAMGVNVVEREGISFTHAAQLLLVGTMNPEEGDLRPQLKDRFGLCVQVEPELDPARRVAIIRRREQYEANPLLFCSHWSAEEEKLRRRIKAARERLPKVKIPHRLLQLVADLCLSQGVPGHRADITLAAAARTLAAWSGVDEVREQDLFQVAPLVLLHRDRKNNQQTSTQGEPGTADQNQTEPVAEEAARSAASNQARQNDARDQQLPANNGQRAENQDNLARGPAGTGSSCHGRFGKTGPGISSHSRPPGMHRMVYNMIRPYLVKQLARGHHHRKPVQDSGRRYWAGTTLRNGRYVRSTAAHGNNDLALDATLRVAAPHQRRRRPQNVAVAIRATDLRAKVREKQTGQLILFVVDASGSMGARQRMTETKCAILSLLLDAYQKRDKIGLVTFRDSTAEVLLPPTNSVELGQKMLRDLPVGGTTPLAAGLLKANDLVSRCLRKNPGVAPLLILITDGKSNVSLSGDKPLVEALQAGEIIGRNDKVKSMVVDVEKKRRVTFGITRELAWMMDADFYRLEELKAETLVDAVRRAK